jgi:hypothetical protein
VGNCTGPIYGSGFSTQITLSVVIGAAKSATTADSRGPGPPLHVDSLQNSSLLICFHIYIYIIFFCYLVKLVPPCPLRMVEVTLVQQHCQTFWSMVINQIPKMQFSSLPRLQVLLIYFIAIQLCKRNNRYLRSHFI